MSSQPDITKFCAELVRIDASGMSAERISLATGFTAQELHEFRMSSEYLSAQSEYVRLRALIGIETREMGEDVVHHALRHARGLLRDPNTDGDFALRAAAVAHRVTKDTGAKGSDMAVSINAPQGVIVMQLPATVAASIRGIDAARINAQVEHTQVAAKFVGMTTSAHMKEFLGVVEGAEAVLAADSADAPTATRVSKIARAGNALLAMLDDSGDDAAPAADDPYDDLLPSDISALL